MAMTQCRAKTRQVQSGGYIPWDDHTDSVWRKHRVPPSASAQVVEEFKRNLKETAKIAAVVGNLDSLKAIATELFERVESLDVVNDPEIPGARYVTITVRAKGKVRSVAEFRREWHRRIEGVLGSDYNLVHLAIDIVEGE